MCRRTSGLGFLASRFALSASIVAILAFFASCSRSRASFSSCGSASILACSSAAFAAASSCWRRFISFLYRTRSSVTCILLFMASGAGWAALGAGFVALRVCLTGSTVAAAMGSVGGAAVSARKMTGTQLCLALLLLLHL